MPETQHRCIHCGSTDLVFSDDKQGFGAGKAVAGALIFGPLGLLAGAAGRNKRHVSIRCNACLKLFTGDEMRARKHGTAPGCLTMVGGGIMFCFVIAIGMAMCSPKNTASTPPTGELVVSSPSAPDMAKPAKAKRHKKAKPSSDEQ